EPSAVVEPTVISVKHCRRLGEGALLATSRYLDRPTLMKRSGEIDVMKCPACGHPMRVLATIREPEGQEDPGPPRRADLTAATRDRPGASRGAAGVRRRGGVGSHRERDHQERALGASLRRRCVVLARKPGA